EGNVQTLARRRGEVVILDFWYRGCGPCIQAMPELKRLATRFSGRPVAVFGMNTDEDAEDARFVAKAMDLNYPTLLVSETDLARSYGASQFGFPTLVIIDQEGVIRWIHTGYAPDISERISEVVEPLLGEK
ncbi:MAG TPA: TlpA disulfide reductase family protein, partial [Isosphaeraceae bacterium]|nr:TlpA disulfide reductase family protein [Isosphaeraceae bacterium]